MTSLLDRNQKLHSLLISLNQSHLFQGWDLNSPLIPSFYEQVNAFHTSYPGGLPSYLNKAKSLLRDAEQGVNPFDGMVPKIPDGENLEHMTTEFLNAERIGIEASHKTAFVLVAGGMGERLGYNGIKIALPSETTSNMTFLELYLTSIMALQQQQQKKNDYEYCYSFDFDFDYGFDFDFDFDFKHQIECYNQFQYHYQQHHYCY